MKDDLRRLFFHEAGHYVVGKKLGINMTSISIERRLNAPIHGGSAFDESKNENIVDSEDFSKIDNYMINMCIKDAAGVAAGYLAMGNIPELDVVYDSFKNDNCNESDYIKFTNLIEDIETNLDIKHDQKDILLKAIEIVTDNVESIEKVVELIQSKFDSSIGNFIISSKELDSLIN